MGTQKSRSARLSLQRVRMTRHHAPRSRFQSARRVALMLRARCPAGNLGALRLGGEGWLALLAGTSVRTPFATHSALRTSRRAGRDALQRRERGGRRAVADAHASRLTAWAPGRHPRSSDGGSRRPFRYIARPTDRSRRSNGFVPIDPSPWADGFGARDVSHEGSALRASVGNGPKLVSTARSVALLRSQVATASLSTPTSLAGP